MLDRGPKPPKRSDAGCPTCGRLTYSISEYAYAIGVSVRQARNQLRQGSLDGGVFRVDDRVMVSVPWLRDQIDAALGINGDPERDADARADAEDAARAVKAREPELARQREAYAAMSAARGDDADAVVYR